MAGPPAQRSGSPRACLRFATQFSANGDIEADENETKMSVPGSSVLSGGGSRGWESAKVHDCLIVTRLMGG